MHEETGSLRTASTAIFLPSIGRVIDTATEGDRDISQLVEHTIYIPQTPSYSSPSSKWSPYNSSPTT
jgi:hypothetical protein